MKFLRILLHVIIIVLLTISTQVGGFAYLIFLMVRHRFSIISFRNKLLHIGLFFAIYSIISFVITPFIASNLFNRMALPIVNSPLQPLRFHTILLNRHYVDKDLYEILLNSSREMEQEFPNTTTFYLDACFPLGANFPMLPHLSHNDGQKIDLAFYYTDPKTGKDKNGSPSWLGYGVYELPKATELNIPKVCEEKGYFQYSFLEKLVPQYKKEAYVFDAFRTKKLIQKSSASAKIKKIFIEPHLKKRMQLTNAKIRFHGCRAVRHDDHIHIQL